MIHEVVRGKVDLVALAAMKSFDHKTAVWAVKRLPGIAHTNNRTKFEVLGILILAALVSILGTLATGTSLARGVRQIRDGLSVLEKHFDFRLPERQDELGKISASISQMASVRGKLETDLRREDRLRALGRPSATLAHEIRNPLNTIRLTVSSSSGGSPMGKSKAAEILKMHRRLLYEKIRQYGLETKDSALASQ